MKPILFFFNKCIFPFDKNLLIAANSYTKRIIIGFSNTDIVLCWTRQSGELTNTNKDSIFPFGILASVGSNLSDTIDLTTFSRVKINKIQKKEDIFFCTYQLIDDKLDSEEFQAFKSIVLDKLNRIKSEFENLYFSIANILILNKEHHLKIFEILKYISAINTADYLEIILKQPMKSIMEFILQFLTEKEKVFEINQRINFLTNEKINKKQKEFFLREKLSSIKEELGEKSEDEDLLILIKNAKLPLEVEKKAIEEYNKLIAIPPVSLESFTIKNYIKWILKLPWNQEAPLNMDVEKAKGILNTSHYGMENVKEEILEYIALSNRLKKPVHLLLVGVPGVGKSTICEAISKATGRPLVRISMAGLNDSAKLKGHSRAYVGSQPGLFIQQIANAGVKNALIQIDECDKIDNYYYKRPADALIDLLDYEQSHKFEDHYMDLQFDFSKCLFILTANRLDTIAPEIIDRVNVIQVEGYSLEEKLHIANMLINQQKTELNLPKLKIDEPVTIKIINEYTRESGVRELKRQIQKIVRKSLINNEFHVQISNVEKFLKKPKYAPEAKEILTSGIVNGLAWTTHGGEILQIECVMAPGTGKFEMTGNLGKVMQESIKMVFAYIRSQCNKWNIDVNILRNNDFFLHAPSANISKDGPSAGVTILTSLVSLLKSTPVSQKVAMTGEMSLSGAIYAIGGLKEKLSACIRCGITTVFIPKKNENVDLPKEIVSKLTLHYVNFGNEIISELFK